MKTAYGEVYWKAGRFVARHVIAAPKKRRAIPLPWTQLPKAAESDEALERAHKAAFEPLAQARSLELGNLAKALRAKLFPSESIARALHALAEHRPETKAHTEAQQVAERIRTVGRVAKEAPKLKPDITLRALGKLLTDGELYKMYVFPDRLRMDSQASRDNAASVLRLYVYPDFGDMPMLSFAPSAVDLVNDWFLRLQEKVESATYATRIRDHFLALLSYGYYPCRLFESPVYPDEARKFLERGKSRKYEPLRPSDYELLMKCTEIPLVWRLYWGTAACNGARGTEWGRLKWPQIDLVNGVVSLNPNDTKTERDSDSWDLDDGCLRAFELYRDYYAPEGSPYVFALTDDSRGRSKAEHVANTRHIEDTFRRHLLLAIKSQKDPRAIESRMRLFEPDEGMRQTTRHHLRALFVMASFCAGMSSEWIRIRTGHKSEDAFDKYKQKLPSWKKFGTLKPLHTLIPEFKGLVPLRRRRTASR